MSEQTMNYTSLNTWLTQKALARILGTSQQNISAHIRRLLKDNPGYERLYVRKSYGSKNAYKTHKLNANYYHETILERLAERIRSESSKSFLEEIRRVPAPRIKLNCLSMHKISQ